MPPINQAALASVGIIAASVAVAAAIALYESPEIRRMADDLRRRIAIAIHSLGDNVHPETRRPRFNRPEDAEGFYQSHDVDADEETRRRQREELMYWNARREELRRERRGSRQRSRGSSFGDFPQPDKTGEPGTFVFNTGANPWDPDSSNTVKRRGNTEGVRGLDSSMLANPFSDEHGIELNDRPHFLEDEHTDIQPRGREDLMSDVYSATPRAQSPTGARSLTIATQSPPAVAPAAERIFDSEVHSQTIDSRSEYATAVGDDETQASDVPTPTSRSTTLERELADDEYMTAGQPDRSGPEVYAAIQAWAQNSSPSLASGQQHQGLSFYSPLPVSPVPGSAFSDDGEMVSRGQLTPTDDSSSMAWSAVDVTTEEARSARGAGASDVVSESDEGAGIPTPGSWSEVASVISESESAMHA